MTIDKEKIKECNHNWTIIYQEDNFCKGFIISRSSKIYHLKCEKCGEMKYREYPIKCKICNKEASK